MAQRVGYFEDFHGDEREAAALSEGPFVAVDAFGFRVEVYDGGKCPHLPDMTIYELLRRNGFNIGKTGWEQCATKVDWLNAKVRTGDIVLRGSYCTA